MTYWARDGDYLKWRCLVACGRAGECRALGRRTASEYGTVFQASIWEGSRGFSRLWRESRKWERPYKQRTAAERVNARLLLDDLTIREVEKVRMHVGLALLVIFSGAWAKAQEARIQQARRLVRLAA